MAMDALSGKSTLPNLEELREVFNMQYLVRCIEYMYFYSEELHHGSQNPKNLFEEMKYGAYPSERRRFPHCLKEGIPGAENATIETFRDAFYRAMYRLLITGAVLAGVYMEPLFRAREEGNDGFLARNGYCWFQDERIDEYMAVGSSELVGHEDEDRLFLRQCPPYNFDIVDWSEQGKWKNGEYEAIFGPFASWIVADGRKRQRILQSSSISIEPDWAENSEDIGAVRELMLLMVAYDHFQSKFENETRDHTGHGPAYLDKAGNRRVSIVRFGVFQVEEVTMPTSVEELRENYLIANFHPALEGSAGADIPYQFDVWYATTGILDGRAKRWEYNRWNRENPGPPPMLELWHFALRRYLNLGFKRGTFWMPHKPMYWDCIWWKEVGGGYIFIDPNWTAVQKYREGLISWA
jgi:hypothetical protein